MSGENFLLARLKNAEFPDDVRNMKWIPVSERLPEYCDFVLVYTIDKTVGEAILDKGRKFYWVNTDEDAEPIAVTHWMPLPTPPKEEDDV